MNKVMVITALAASLLVSTAAIAAPANLAGAFTPEGGLTLVRGGGGGGGAGVHVGGGGGDHMGDAGAHFSGNHIGSIGGPGAGPHFEGNGHPNGHFDKDHFGRADFDHEHNRFFPGSFFVYGGDYADYGYSGDCSWLRRQATVTGSGYWLRRYQACL